MISDNKTLQGFSPTNKGAQLIFSLWLTILSGTSPKEIYPY